jgi:hypothetical protein
MEYNAQNPTMRPGRHPDGLICPTGAQTQWRGPIQIILHVSYRKRSQINSC